MLDFDAGRRQAPGKGGRKRYHIAALRSLTCSTFSPASRAMTALTGSRCPGEAGGEGPRISPPMADRRMARATWLKAGACGPSP